MGEIKHSFTAGKMNKDLDERLVPQGQYRDAMNIQVRTTSGDSSGEGIGNAGVVQNLQGNVSVGTATGELPINTSFADTDFTCIGSIAHEKTDSAYFFFTSDIFLSTDFSSTSEIIKIDTIIEHSVETGLNVPVIVDRWAIQTPIANVWSSAPTGTITSFTAVSTLASKIRVNMDIEFYDSGSPDSVTVVKIKKIDGNTIHLYDQIVASGWSSFTHAKFVHPRALNFSKKRLINGINIIDNLLFWTDGATEPKKINIDRCKEGTNADGTTHTQLFITNPNTENLENAGTLELNGLSGDILEEHITVLRPAPKTPPTVHVEARDDAELEFDVEDFSASGLDDDGVESTINLWNFGGIDTLNVGDVRYIGTTWNNNLNQNVNYGTVTPSISTIPFEIGDIFTVTQQDVEEGFSPIIFKVKFLGYFGDMPNADQVDTPTDFIKVEVIKAPPDGAVVSNTMDSWSFKISNIKDSKFELKFPRFAYRYKYEDGEYSAFSPFSELAFDPGLFDYDPVKGYNLGMVNTINKLVIKDFIPYYTDRALDITDVEILYKSTDSPNIYTIKNIRKLQDGEWELFTPDGDADDNDTTQDSLETGKLEIKSETIHKVLPSNQTLRTFDNVPRYALAQEITGSRILYGNFVQGFDIKYPVGLNQDVVSEAVNGQPKKSVKTIRNYKVGMVFGDKYGRETPVIVSNKISELTSGFAAQTDDLIIPKDLCAMSNKLSVKQVWDKPGMPSGDPSSMTWMEYVKYYVKETSNEYYNLVLDRWYKAKKENNIWLSFPSADRNKVDIETYLFLKKSHGSGDAILEKARYKIIDIKSEAPDFIKTERRNMGLVNITGDPTDDTGYSPIGAADPQINEPFLLTSPTNTKIEVPQSQWDGFLNLYGENKRGQLFVRVVGRTENPASGAVFNQLNSGEFKKVTHHYVKPSNERGVVHYEDSFLGSADMVDRFAAVNYPIDGSCASQCLQYYFEFEERVIENRPEFDGRFFVLIEKDSTTEEQIELTTQNASEFAEVAQFTISYVDSQRFNPARSGPFSIEENTGDVDKFGARGIMTDFTTGQIDGEDSIKTDLTQPCEWWGFDSFSKTEPYDDYYTSNGTVGFDDIKYDSKQANFFALGCNHEEYSELEAYSGMDPISNLNGSNPDIDTNGTVNYGAITRAFWKSFKAFHKSSDSFGYGDTGDDNQKIANRNLIFLDGARATRFMLQEYGTNANETVEQGVPHINTGDDIKIISNDSVAEVGSIGYEDPVGIYNYKPTALDEGHADNGLGRMTISRLGSEWSGATSGGGAGAFYNYFAGPSASGTYFSFTDDKSDTSDPDNFPDGRPHIYKVVTVHPLDEDIALPIQKSLSVHNFGSQNTHIAEDLSGKSKPLYAWDYIDYNIPDTNQTSNYGVNFGGENAACVDENGYTGHCWEGLDAAFNPTPDQPIQGDSDGDGVNDISHSIRVGTFSNEGDDPMRQWKFFRTCGKCAQGTQGGTGNYDEGALCGRSSIRFEFRKVNIATGEVTNDGITNLEEFDPRGQAKHDGTHGGIKISILLPGVVTGGEEIEVEEDRAVWETEPKEDVGLDLYYEATHALPLKLKQGNTLSHAPLKSRVIVERENIESGAIQIDNLLTDSVTGTAYKDVKVGGVEYLGDKSIIKVISTNVVLSQSLGQDFVSTHETNIGIGDTIVFEHTSGLQTRSVVQGYYVAPTTGQNCTYTPATEVETTLTYNPSTSTITLGSTTGIVNGMNVVHPQIPPGVFISQITGTDFFALSTMSFFLNGQVQQSLTGVKFVDPTGYYQIDSDVYKYKVKLGWHNCYSFGNGVESDRIRDDFNATTIDNGVKVSTTVEEYGQEDRTNSLIFSGLYNTTSGVNDLNEFNMGEKIIKDLNPEYGHIQALKTRDNDVVTFCEDRILKVLANKEAVFLADGAPQLTATDRVLGQVSTFKGDYGISRNPESLASDQYRLYFTDSQRGAVLRLSMDGLTPISNVGMKTWFRDNIIGVSGYGTRLLGTFDKVNGEYNLGVSNQTMVSFNEGSKGWISFKSYIPDQGVSVSGKYLTVKHGTIYEHYKDTYDEDGNINNRNLFYGATELTNDSESSLTVMFNDVPSQVKSFKAMNYEGSQARIDQFTSYTVDNVNYTDGEYYNIFPDKKGWWVDSVETDLQSGKAEWFVDKENKWFNKICGTATTLENLDTSEFTVQGIGSPIIVSLPTETTDTTSTTTTTTDDGDTVTTVDPVQYTFTIENNTNND